MGTDLQTNKPCPFEMKLAGVLDFDDMCHGPLVFDIISSCLHWFCDIYEFYDNTPEPAMTAVELLLRGFLKVKPTFKDDLRHAFLPAFKGRLCQVYLFSGWYKI